MNNQFNINSLISHEEENIVNNSKSGVSNRVIIFISILFIIAGVIIYYVLKY